MHLLLMRDLCFVCWCNIDSICRILFLILLLIELLLILHFLKLWIIYFDISNINLSWSHFERRWVILIIL